MYTWNLQITEEIVICRPPDRKINILLWGGKG